MWTRGSSSPWTPTTSSMRHTHKRRRPSCWSSWSVGRFRNPQGDISQPELAKRYCAHMAEGLWARKYMADSAPFWSAGSLRANPARFERELRRVLRQIADSCRRAAEPASGIALEADGAEFGSQPVIDDEPARQALAQSQQLLQHLGRLQARRRCRQARRRCRLPRSAAPGPRQRLGEDAAVAGMRLAQIGLNVESWASKRTTAAETRGRARR